MLSNIGQIYNDRGNIREALSYEKESLAMFKTLYGDSPHLKVASALFSVGISYQALLDPDNALLHLQQSLKVYAELADSELCENMADVLNQIGLIYFGQKDFEQGLVYFRQIVEVYKSQGGGHVYFGQAQAMQNMGTSYIELKDFSKAILHLEEALNIYKTLFKNQVKPVVLNCLASIGYAYEQISNFPESVSRYKQALEMSQKLYDVDGASYKSGYFTEKIARVYGHMHNLALQISYLQTAKDMYQRLGKQKAERMSVGTTTYTFITDENIARTQYDIGWAYCLLGDLQQSLTHFSYASNDYKILYKENKVLYKKNEVTEALLVGPILSLRMVGMVYSHLGKYKQAEKYYKKSLRMAKKLKQLHLCASIYHHLGCLYRSASYSAGKEKTKQRYCDKATEAFEAALAVNDVPSIALLTDYAHLLLVTRKYQQAYDYLVRAIATGDEQDIVEYTLAEPATVTSILQARINQEKLTEVRAIDYAFYLLLHHYEALQQAGITPTQSRETCLAAYTQGINARAGQPGKEKQDVLARYLLDNLQGAPSVH
jgi:tetratricopeptide (TPR) repeat protein